MRRPTARRMVNVRSPFFVGAITAGGGVETVWLKGADDAVGTGDPPCGPGSTGANGSVMG
jgi:hypothetical protein